MNKIAPSTPDVEQGGGDQVTSLDPASYPNPAYDATVDDPVPYSKATEAELKDHATVVVANGELADRVIPDKPYPGMNKEDLLRFSDTPFWNNFRLVSLVIFGAAWLALLGAVIGLTIAAPRCGDRPTPDWWQNSTTVYQIYVRSFYDSDGNGVGDLAGITAKLDYLEELFVDAILLSSVYRSEATHEFPDYGYEVTNHMELDPIYGTLDDLRELIREADRRGIAVLLDFIPNHTGKSHDWFVRSSASKDYDNEFWNYYVWANCEGDPDTEVVTTPPNNWLSVYGGSAWKYSATRGQCYLHQFFETQPELNLRSSAVQKHLQDILEYWLDVGVDGFMVSSSMYLFESADLRNETIVTGCTDLDDYNCLNHTHTVSQPEVYDMVVRWRKVLDDYSNNNKTNSSRQSRILLTDGDVTYLRDALGYYGTRGEGANLPINYIMSHAKPGTCHHHRSSGAVTDQAFPSSGCVMDDVKDLLDGMPFNTTACWTVSDADRKRPATNLGPEFLLPINMISLTLPGTAVVYYGNEIGMTDYNDTRRNPPNNPNTDNPRLSRDQYRTPMHWTNDIHANFTLPDSTPWLEVNPNYLNISVMEQSSSSATPLSIFKNLTELRRYESLRYGAIHYLDLTAGHNHDVVAFVREHEGFDRMLTVVNFSGDDITTAIDLRRTSKTISIPSKASVVVTNKNTTSVTTGKDVNLDRLLLESGQGFIAKWDYQRPN